MRSLTEVLVSLVTNVLLLILWVALAIFLLGGFLFQIKFLLSWLFSKGSKKKIKLEGGQSFPWSLWWACVVGSLIIWFFNK